MRHWLYPGQVNWTEEGHNFSWHMKLRIKTGQTVFVVVDRDKVETWEVRPRDQLTTREHPDFLSHRHHLFGLLQDH